MAARHAPSPRPRNRFRWTRRSQVWLSYGASLTLTGSPACAKLVRQHLAQRLGSLAAANQTLSEVLIGKTVAGWAYNDTIPLIFNDAGK
jgi:hypothetical protein